jgi:plastocyanin
MTGISMRRALVVPALILLTTFASAAHKKAHAQMSANSNMVVMKNFDFSPMTLTVPAGTTVTWKNTDGEPHTVTSTDGLFRSGALDTNDHFSFKFAKPGTYKYVCSIHPKMQAAVIVK